MTTGLDLRNTFLNMLKIPSLSYGFVNRCTPEVPPHNADCSGAISWAVAQQSMGWGCTGSFWQSRWCHQHNTGGSVAQAFAEPGWLLFQGANEGQGALDGSKDGVWPGHVGMSFGDGVHTIEARGHWAGVGVFNAGSLRWDWAARVPGVTYGGSNPTVPAPTLSTKRLEKNVTMIVLKPTDGTQTGRTPTARPVPEFNFVLLEDGARLQGDVQIDAHRHWWAPPNLNKDIPGAQIIDIADCRIMPAPYREDAVAVRYGYPNGDAGTYKAQMV